MKTIEKVYCPICNSNSLTLLVHRCQYSLYKCKSCGLTFKNIENLSYEIVQKLQDNVYTESYLITRLQQRRWIKKMNRDRLNTLCKWVKRGDLLEIGCGTGEFLHLAREFGFNVVGVDASQMLVEIAFKKKEIDVRCGRIEDLEFSMSHFDVICIFHLIEHIEAPKAFLAHLRGLLKQNGILFIITPNVKSFTNKIFGWKHPNYTQKDHLYFYSRDTLKYILINQGFEVVSIFSKEYAHHPFTSFIGFLRTHLKSNKVNYKSVMTTINSRQRAKILIGFKSILKWTIWQAPHFIGVLWYPISWPYRNSVEKAIEGHELIVIAKKIKK